MARRTIGPFTIRARSARRCSTTSKAQGGDRGDQCTVHPAGRPFSPYGTAIQRKCGIEPHSILISASHTHSGGPIGYYLPGEFDDESPLVRSLVHDRTVCADPEYLAKVKRAIVEAVCTGRFPADRGPGQPGSGPGG